MRFRRSVASLQSYKPRDKLPERQRLSLELGSVAPPVGASFAGVAGYAYQQVGCDGGSGDTVGCFRSQIFGIGPQLGLRFPIGEMQGYVGLKAYGEFGAKNTPQGWNTWLTLTISPAEPIRR